MTRHTRSSSRSAARAAARGAFTLVEILVVVVILGIVSAVILPQIGSRDDLRVAASARIVTADLLYAQNLAISKQQPHYVRFNGNGYGLYTVATGGTPITHPLNKTEFTAAFGSTGSPGMQSTTLTSADFDGNTTLVFDELGAPYSYSTTTNSNTPLAAAGQVKIACGTHTMTVNVEPFTGELTITQP